MRAEIVSSNRCEAAGYTTTGHAPVLALYRVLIEAGFDPATPLHAYRGDTLCLTVNSIGWGAGHSVGDNRSGTPVLQRYTGMPDTVLSEPRPCVRRHDPPLAPVRRTGQRATALPGGTGLPPELRDGHAERM